MVRDLVDIETAHFWKDSPEVRSASCKHRGDRRPRSSSCPPPATWRRRATSPTRSACCSGTTRRSTRRATRAPSWFTLPPGQAPQGALRGLRARRATGRSATSPGTIRSTGPSRADADAVLREINGYDLADGRARDRVRRAARPTAATACGCWIYSGLLRRRRQPAAPAQRRRSRRAGRLGLARVGLRLADEPAHPLQPRLRRPGRQAVVGAQEADLVGRGAGSLGRATTCPTSRRAHRPDYRPAAGRRGHGRAPRRLSVHHDAGRQGVAVHSQRACSTRRCPRTTSRSSRRCPTSSIRRSAPTRSAITFERPENPLAEPADDRYPHVASTFRLTEHHTAGPMSRNLPWLAELQPEMFAEIDPVLARAAGIEDGGWMVVETAARRDRGAREGHQPDATAADGRRRCTRSCLPWHWGVHDERAGRRRATRPTTSSPSSGDPNVTIHESKALPLQGARGPARGRDDGDAWRTRARAAPARPGRAEQPTAWPHGAEHAPLRRRATGRSDMLDGESPNRDRARRPSAWASSPTRPSASAARRARSPASSGTTCPPTRTRASGISLRQHGHACRRPPGATCASWRRSPAPTRPSRRGTWSRRRGRGLAAG